MSNKNTFLKLLSHSYRKVFAKTCLFQQTDKNNNFIVTEITFKNYLSYNSWAADA